jgi:AcrR family transcriptional regulator
MGVKELKTTRNQGGRETKALILETAAKVARSHGLEGITIGELAKAVGMSKSGLFAHFQGKENLQLTILKMATDQFVERVFKKSFREPRGEPRVRAIFENWIHFIDGDKDGPPLGGIFIAACFELDDRPGALRDYLRQVQNDLIGNLTKAVKLAVENKDFHREVDAELFAWTLYSFILGYHHFKFMLKDERALEHVRKSFEGLLKLSKA